MRIKGFSAAAVEAGIARPGRLDLGLMVSDCPAVAAGVFTTNRIKAAPVLLDQRRLQGGRMRALVVNSGIANACTGEAGMEAALEVSAMTAGALGVPEELVLVSSTGVIGEQLPVERFRAAMPELVSRLSPEGFDDLARAMMTTDTVPKTCGRVLEIGGREVNILGLAKGAGMIMPNMATMLAFVVTDAQIVFPHLRRILLEAVEESFNRITVDGDTSTNDMVIVMANGMAGNDWLDDGNEEGLEAFGAAVRAILLDLALKIVADGEGATKQVTIRVTGARDAHEAEDAARAIAGSLLVKTAFAGEDANWGRIIAALGRSDCRFRPDKVDILFDSVKLVEDGLGLGPEAEARATEVLRRSAYTLTVALREGMASATVYTCDLTADYVRINADYRS